MKITEKKRLFVFKLHEDVKKWYKGVVMMARFIIAYVCFKYFPNLCLCEQNSKPTKDSRRLKDLQKKK